MKKTKGLFAKFLIAAISLCMVFLSVSPAMADTVGTQGSEDVSVTVCVSMEKFTLGQDYIIEPTLVKVKKDTLASVVITDLLKAKYPNMEQPWRMTGSLDNSFYLSAVYDPDRATPSIPQFILDHAKINVDGGNGDWLGEFDYHSMSGWMYCVNGKFPNVGAAQWPMQDGQVMRWQFTLYGYGADLGAGNIEWGTPDITDVGNKDKLTWEVAKCNAIYDKGLLMQDENYVNALTMLKNPEAPQEQLDAALTALKENGPRFSDVAKDAWYKTAVDYVLESGLFKGTSSTEFSPEGNLTRGMVITVIHRLAGEHQVQPDAAAFTDVNADDWYGPAASWAAGEGITAGLVSGKIFQPEEVVTREQLADLLYRYVQTINSQVTPKGDFSSFADSNQVSSMYKEAVSWAVGEGILNGSDGNLSPGDNLTRSQFAAMIMRLAEIL